MADFVLCVQKIEGLYDHQNRKCVQGGSMTVAKVGEPIKINCDQVAWLMKVLKRQSNESSPSKASRLGSLLEIMTVLNLKFEDNSAAGNALSEFTEFNSLRGVDL